ncbi:MAG TPA: S41 family peptidase [Alphaproteobacteria bacterium]|nr:S41 family peptidase [Alphaproteobacteria bacterium]
MNRQSIAAALVVLISLALPLTAATESRRSDTYRQLDLFSTVFERVRASYVEEVTDDKLVSAAINGMLSRLDPHSSYMDAKTFREMQVQTRGQFGGLGIEVTMEKGFVKVVSPIDDTPAARAGIEPNDFITHIDGKAVLGLSLSEAVEKMRGKVGSKIRITIRRIGQAPFDVTITRAVIRIRTVRARLEGNIGYVRITSFNERAASGAKAALEKFKKQLGGKLAGIVLDLRNNPGGLLDQSIAVSDIFLSKGEIVSTRGRQANSAQRFNARAGDLAQGLPIVVLINGGSASASEIVAGALQDHRRAIILGTRSFGKGSVQTIIPLRQGSAMRLTTARYYTPSGRSIQAKGIEPDIIVEQAKVETIKTGSQRREADLRGALDTKKKEAEKAKGGAAGKSGGTSGTKPEAGKAVAKAKPQDYQLARALDLLRGLAFYKSRAVN